jgi:hypothetical protein
VASDENRYGSAKANKGNAWPRASANLCKMVNEGKGQFCLRSIMPIRRIPYLHPDHPLDRALWRTWNSKVALKVGVA